MRIVFVDVFATEKFKGNSAAVCFAGGAPGGEEPQPAYMQALAAAHALWEAEPERGALRFVTNTSTVAAQRTESGVEISLPSHPPRAGLVPPMLEAALGVRPLWTGFAENKLCAVLESEAQVRGLQPDLALIAALPVAGVVVTARGASPFDFVSRYFAPSIGVPEDAVTGSAHAVLAPVWAERLGKPSFVAYQASARGGVLHLRVEGDQVAMAGAAVTVLRGELT